MSSGGAVTKGAPVKGLSSTANNVSSKKANKSDSKSDKADLTPKLQATAEQMQIAKIIDTHRAEDPELQKKIKQVMEITRTTEDQACMALHSREYDIEQAITLLTEGGSQSLESEWAQAGKKKKAKNSAKAEIVPTKESKPGKDGDRNSRDKSEKRDSKSERKDLEGAGDQPFGSGEQRRSDRGGRSGRGGRGRSGSSRGGRADKENDDRGGRIMNGPGRGRGFGRGGRGGRTFASRSRGDRENDTYNTMDVWENSQADGSNNRDAPLKVENWGEFPATEDWDNEEYTGSLADTKVFTASSQSTQGPLSNSTNGVGNSGQPNSNHLQSASNSAELSKLTNSQDSDSVSMGGVVPSRISSVAGSTVAQGQSIDLTMLLPKAQQSATGSTTGHTNPGVDLLATLQSSFSNSNQLVSGQALPQRNKVQRPRGPPSKIPASAVEMPEDSSTSTLDVQFGGMDLSSESSLSFSSVMQSNKTNAVDSGLIYGSQTAKLEQFVASTAEKDGKSGHSSSPFQNQINSQTQGSISDPSKGNITTGTEILSSLGQSQVKAQHVGSTTYGVPGQGSTPGSAFVSYGSAKVAPGFPAPGFPPVSQNQTGTYNNSSVAPVTGGLPAPSTYGQVLPNQPGPQSGYMANLPYGNQPTNIPSQPNPSSNPNVPYGTGNATHSQSAYHLNSNSSYSGGSSSGSAQYGNYTQKASGFSSSSGVKDSTTDVGSNVPVSSSGTASSQMGSNIQQTGVNSATSASTSTKLSAPTNTTTNTSSKMNNTTMPPGMVVQPQYILGQGGTVPAYFSVQTPMYGYDDNSVQFLPRFPPNMTQFYDASGAAGYGVSGRNDGATMPAYNAGGDARFPRSDSSTASPVPSNLPGGSTQQPMYNPTMPYYFVGNNMVHGTHYPYGPPPQMFQTPMATAASATAPHAANHQYQGKGVYSATQYTYDTSQGGPGTDFSKSSYSSGSGPNSNSNKVASGSSSGVSQSTDMNSSMYAKGHNMGKMNSFDKSYGASGAGGYSSMSGAQLGSQLGGHGMGTPYGVYLTPQPVQTLPMHQDGGSSSRQGPVQSKGKQQSYYQWNT